MFDVVSAHPGDLLVRRLRQAAGVAATAQAELYAAVWAVVEASAAAGATDEESVIDEFAADEVRAALMLTRRAADVLVGYAYELCVRLPEVWKALHGGAIDDRRARVIVDGLRSLPLEEARTIAADVVPDAGDLTTGQLRARLRRMVTESDPGAAAARYHAGVEERRVTLTANDDGTANLCAWNLEADRASALMRKVASLANGLPRDDRTADQRRADVFLDLVDGSGDAGPRATVDIHVELTTLLALDERAGDIPGWGPVIADVARQVIEDQPQARWRVSVSEGGEPLWSGVTRRRPTARQRRDVGGRSRTCVFPGCRMPATQSDLDHTVAWSEGGPTEIDNLAPLCRHDHRLKHEGGWTLRREKTGLTWTSRLGQRYAVSPQGP